MSVGDLFLGAVFPGLVLTSLYIIYIILFGLLQSEKAPAATQEQFSRTDLYNLCRSILPPLFLIVAVLGSIFFGIATPTEAAGVGACGALLLTFINKKCENKINIKGKTTEKIVIVNLLIDLKEVLQETTRTTAFIFAILLGATAFSLVLRGLGGDELIERSLLGLPFGSTGIIVCILLATFLLGFFLDWIELTLIVLPLVSPVVNALGFDPIWFTILFAVCLQTSFLTPPVGFAIFYLRGVAPPEVDIKGIYRGVMPFVLLQIIGVIIIFHFSSLVTWLPQQAYGG